MPYFEHDGVHLFYLVEGYGKVVLLLHSWTCDMHDWSFQIPMLVTHGFTTITMDTRGHGRSTLPTNQDYSMNALAGDAVALLDHLGIDEAVIAGHSTGAVVASAIAMNRPDIIRGLILIDPAYYLSERERGNLVEGLQTPDSPERAASLFARALYTPESPAYLKAWHMRRARCTPAETVSHSLIHLFSPGNLGLWESMQSTGQNRAGPRFVICTSETFATKERQLGMGEQDRIEIISASSWPHQQDAKRFNDLLASWLNACELHG